MPLEHHAALEYSVNATIEHLAELARLDDILFERAIKQMVQSYIRKSTERFSVEGIVLDLYERTGRVMPGYEKLIHDEINAA